MIGTSLQHLQIGVYICVLILSTFAVSCRIWARRIMSKSLQANDYLMIAAYICVVVQTAMALAMVINTELGLHSKDIDPERFMSVLQYVLQANFVMSVLMMLGTSLVKLSMTEFYLHLFPQAWMHRICYAQITALSVFMIAQIIADLLLCRPIAKSWNFMMPGECGDFNAFWLSVSMIALLFEVICVLLPMPIFWTLRLDSRKKCRLTVLFGLGFVICGLTGLRVWVYRQIDYGSDATWGFAHGVMLILVEPTLGIVAGCIPIMAPCLSSVKRRFRPNIPSTTTGVKTKPANAGGATTVRKSNPFQRLEDHMYPLTDVKCSRAYNSRGSSTEELTEEMGDTGAMGVTRVQREIVIDSRSEENLSMNSEMTKR